MAASPAGDLARRLGIRTGRVAAPAGLAAIVIGALLFLLPPHSTIAALFAAVTVAGRGLVLHTFGVTESCQVVHREEVDTGARYQHYGFVHTLACPLSGTFTIRTDSTDRQPEGAQVAVLDDPGGLLEPDFAGRHNLAVDIIAVFGSIALVLATVRFTRVRVRAAS